METTFTDIAFFVFSYLCFQRTHILNEENNSLQKAVIAEEELDDIDINVDNLLELVFIDKECGNTRAVS